MALLPQPGRTPCFLFVSLALLASCSENDAPDDDLRAVKPPEIVRITPAQEALQGAHVPTLDPATMHEAAIRMAVEPGPRCDFRYTSAGKPVLAISLNPDGAPRTGVVKVNGHLIALAPTSEAAGGERGERFLMVSDPVRIAVTPDARELAASRQNITRREADMIFEVGKSLRVGYRGYLDCTADPPTVLPGHTSGRRD